MWTYAELKAADAALSPAVADLSDAAAALNAQAATVSVSLIPWTAIRKIARESATGDWPRIVKRAALPLAGTAGDAAILVATNAVESRDTDLIDPASPVWQGGLAVLQAAGDLSHATIDAIAALSTATTPKWDPPVTPGDIQTAREQP